MFHQLESDSGVLVVGSHAVGHKGEGGLVCPDIVVLDADVGGDAIAQHSSPAIKKSQGEGLVILQNLDPDHLIIFSLIKMQGQRGAGQDRVDGLVPLHRLWVRHIEKLEGVRPGLQGRSGGLSKEAVPHLVERGAIKWVLLGYGGRFRHNRAFCGLWGLSDLRNLGGLGALGASGASVP